MFDLFSDEMCGVVKNDEPQNLNNMTKSTQNMFDENTFNEKIKEIEDANNKKIDEIKQDYETQIKELNDKLLTYEKEKVDIDKE